MRTLLILVALFSQSATAGSQSSVGDIQDGSCQKAASDLLWARLTPIIKELNKSFPDYLKSQTTCSEYRDVLVRNSDIANDCYLESLRATHPTKKDDCLRSIRRLTDAEIAQGNSSCKKAAELKPRVDELFGQQALLSNLLDLNKFEKQAPARVPRKSTGSAP